MYAYYHPEAAIDNIRAWQYWLELLREIQTLVWSVSGHGQDQEQNQKQNPERIFKRNFPDCRIPFQKLCS